MVVPVSGNHRLQTVGVQERPLPGAGSLNLLSLTGFKLCQKTGCPLGVREVKVSLVRECGSL